MLLNIAVDILAGRLLVHFGHEKFIATTNSFAAIDLKLMNWIR